MNEQARNFVYITLSLCMVRTSNRWKKKKQRVKDITKGTICVNTPEQKELRSEHILLNVKLW